MPFAAKRILVVFFALFFAVACGQKGPLFLPGDTSSIRMTAPPQAEQEQDDEEDEDEDIPQTNNK